MEQVHLISASPRRRTLLEQMGIPCIVAPVDIHEDMNRDLTPEELAGTIAREKLGAFLKTGPADIRWAVAADTFISFGGRTVGKPADREEAYRELKNFSGNTHQVLTGVSLYRGSDGTIITETGITDVTFRNLSEEEILRYLRSGEWEGVAGSYRIQGKGECLISGINGSYSNVMGLPITRFYGMLTKLNYSFDKFPAA